MAGKEITRRELMRTTGAIAAGAAAARLTAAAPAKTDTSKILNYNPKMGYRRLGKTGVMISEVGLGGHWKTRSGNYYDITTAGEAAIYGRCAKQTGIKLHIGYSDHILCIRNPRNRTVEKMMVEIDAGLRRLMVDCMFLWRPQALMGGGHTKAELDRVLETYHKAHKAGKVQYLGMSAHSHDFVRQVIEQYGEHYHAFVFMYTVSNEPKRSGSMFETLGKKDVGAIGLKPFHGNSYFARAIKEARKKGTKPDLNKLALDGLKKILEVPQMTCTIPGMTTVDEVENNVKASYDRKNKLAEADRRAVGALAAASLKDLPPDYAFIREQITV